MTLALPTVTSDRVCCRRCGQRAPYLANGQTDWHLDGDAVCLDVWPPYVDGAPQPAAGRRRPVAHRTRRPR